MTLRLAVTPGEPAGIGLDMLIQAVQQGSTHQLIAYADPDFLQDRAALLGLPLTLHQLPDNNTEPQVLKPGELYVAPIISPEPATPGTLTTATAPYVLKTLHRAVVDCQKGRVDAMITGPVHKGIINDAGIPFTGHTEFLARETATDQVVMMLASRTLRVALATTHLPLRDVANAVTRPLLEQVIKILHHDLRCHFGIDHPRILVCGLNPHAGEGGHLGDEEITIITPLVNAMIEQGYQLTGPLPADTLFTPKVLAGHDAVLAMYHDQGLPVLKHSGFGESANITLGLPIIRTSVDHGTALDLAGTGLANPGSLMTAIEQAALMAEKKLSRQQDNEF